MDAFGRAALLGFCFGFLWGIGCSLAIMYSVYLGGYRKAAKDSLKPVKPARFTQVLEKIQARRAEKKAASAPSKPL